MSRYAPLCENAGQTRPDTVAFRNHRDKISFKELHEACLALRSQLGNLRRACIALRCDHDVHTFVGIHALNYCGHTVVLLREEQGLEQSPAEWFFDASSRTLTAVIPQQETTNVEEARTWDWDEPMFYIQSSGTTGVAKWLPLTTRQVHLSAFGSAIRLGHLPGDAWLNPLAPGFMGWLAILTRCALYGTTMFSTPWHLESMIALLRQEQFSQISLVPTMLQQIVELDSNCLQKVRTILVGGGPTEPALLKRCRSEGLSVVATWGMTEAASQISTQHADQAYQCGHSGSVMPFIDIRVEDGVFHLDGPLVNEPFKTRDMGFIDEQKRVFVQGRIDDVIISGGLKFHPATIEAQIKSFGGIRSCCVIGCNDRTWGQRIVAVVVVESIGDLEGRINDFREHLSKMSSRGRPREVWLSNYLPTNKMLKPLRSLVRILVNELHQTMLFKASDELIRQGRSLEGSQINTRMGQTYARSEQSREVDNVMAKNDGALGALDYPRFNTQFVALSHGIMEATFSMNEGQSGRMFLKQLIPVAEDRKEKFFEGDMGVFEDATIENDACAVDLVESRSEIVTKGHDVNLLVSKGKAKL